MALSGSRESPSGSAVRLRGLFADGTWMCNCKPRLPAEHFQTKNGGQNHGRWFYTCQKPQRKRCNFFLWEDDAKPREATVLLNNSRAEADRSADTISASSHVARPHTPDIDWPNSDDEREMGQGTEKTTRPGNFPETPRKEPRRDWQASPGARSASASTTTTPSIRKEDVFVTPATQRHGATTGLITPGETPAARRFQDAVTGEPPPFNISPARLDSELSTELLDRLRDLGIDLTEDAVAIIKSACKREARKAQGLEKGRDVIREVVKKKDIEIAKLKDKITELEGEREKHRTIIKHLHKERYEGS